MRIKSFLYIFAPQMEIKEKILTKAVDLHFKYGIKNVTMDQIAGELGMSKKTIYRFFKNKNILVKEAVDFIFDQIQKEIHHICSLDLNPYEELFAVKKIIEKNLKKSNASPYHQLKKYYPEIAKSLESRKFKSIMECLEHNLNKGIQLGYYKKDLNKEFIKRMYYINSLNLADTELFPPEIFDKQKSIDLFLKMFFSGISTPLGLKELNKIIQS